MPPAPPVANVLKVAYSGTVGERNWANIVHFLYSGGAPASSALDTWAAQRAAAWTVMMTPEQHPSVILTKVIVTDLTSLSSGQGTWLGAIPGTRSGNELTGQNAMLINYVPDTRYRGGKPRQYLVVGVQGDLNDSQTWDDTIVSSVQTGWNDIHSGVIGTTIGTSTLEAFGMVSYKNASLHTPPPIFVAYVGNTGVASDTVATIRRRVRRVARRR